MNKMPSIERRWKLTLTEFFKDKKKSTRNVEFLKFPNTHDKESSKVSKEEEKDKRQKDKKDIIKHITIGNKYPKAVS